MQMASEIMDDAMNEMTGEEEDEEAERILQEVMEKAGMADVEKLGGTAVPSSATQGHAYQNLTPDLPDMDNVDDRMAQLRR
jgi:division protein CdvB (Snf7/Vps24/ESCRT-III family)